MKRRKSQEVKVGKVKIGGDAPVVVQGMTKTNTEDGRATVEQVRKLSQVGAEIVRIALPTIKAAKVLSYIKQEVEVPLVADIHFSYRIALEAIKQGVDKIRINPGNMGKGEIVSVANEAKDKGIPLRVGVNSGSLEKGLLNQERRSRIKGEDYRQIVAEAMVKSVLRTVALLEKERFRDTVISLKAPDILTTIRAYQIISDKIPYPLHLGVTATGPNPQGIVKSSIGIGTLLAQGIGDTIRVSLTADPVEEVRIGYEILQSLDLFKEKPILISCPICGRCRVDLESIVREVQNGIDKVKIPLIIAIMGCEVNGPGEAKQADIGIACTKKGGVLFKEGKVVKKVEEKNIAKVLLEEIEKLSYESQNKVKKALMEKVLCATGNPVCDIRHTIYEIRDDD